MPRAICSVEGCDRSVHARGWCKRCWQRWSRTGDPLVVRPRGPVPGTGRKPPKPCSIADCPGTAKKRGWCEMHYLRWRRTGDPLVARPRWRSIDVSNGKVCKTCGVRKPVSEFYRQPDGRYGGKLRIPAHCKECVKAARRADLEADPEPNKRRSRAYHAAHREEARHKAKLYRDTNRDAVLAQKRAHQQANRAAYNAAADRHRKRKLANWVEDVERAVVFRRDQGLCGICGLPVDPSDWQLDHIVPVSVDGEHSYANVQVAHPFCNRSKGNRLVA